MVRITRRSVYCVRVSPCERGRKDIDHAQAIRDVNNPPHQTPRLDLEILRIRALTLSCRRTSLFLTSRIPSNWILSLIRLPSSYDSHGDIRQADTVRYGTVRYVIDCSSRSARYPYNFYLPQLISHPTFPISLL